MAVTPEILGAARRLADLNEPRDFFAAAAAELSRLISGDDILWLDSNFPAGYFQVWRASLGQRDDAAEKIAPHLRRHPAIESYLRNPADLHPRRSTDPADLCEPENHAALELSEQTYGRRQLGMITRVDDRSGVGRGWLIVRDDHDFDEQDLETASLLMPMLIALDRVHEVLSDRSRTDRRAAPAGDREHLSTRERQVVDLLGTGMTARAIGTVLGISPRTVGKHLEHAYKKLGMHDRLLVSQSVSPSSRSN